MKSADWNKMGHTFSLFLVVVASAMAAQATTYYVKPDGDDSKDGKSWATALKSPQTGFSKVHNKDTTGLELVIAPGVYDLTDACACAGGTAESRRVVIRGETCNPADVTLKGNGTFEIVRLSHNVTMSGLTVANGSNSNRLGNASGVRIGSNAENRLCIVSNCVVTGCYNAYTNKTMKTDNGKTFEIYGGPVYVFKDGLLVDSVVSNNTARYRGCGVTFDGATATALRCSIEGNSARVSGDSGVSVYGVNGSSGRLVDCVVQSNITAYCAGARDVAYIEGCTFRGNILDPAKGNHSSTAMSINIPTVVTNCTFVENQAEKGFGTVYVTEWETQFRDCRFIGNVVSNYAAGINFHTGSSSACRAKVESCVFADNSSHNGSPAGGGAIRLAVGYVDVIGCTFTNNAAHYGGAIDVVTNGTDKVSCLTCTNCLFVNNTALDCGGGVRVANAARALFDDCKFIANKTTLSTGGNDEGGGGVYLYKVTEGGWLVVSNSVFAGNYGERGGGFGSTWNHTTTPYGLIQNCVFTNNSSYRQGGGLSIRVNVTGGDRSDDLFTIRNSLFAFNRTTYPDSKADSAGGGILLVDQAPVTIENCTIASNVTAYTKSGGLHMPWNGRIVNCIVANNLIKGGTTQDSINWVSTYNPTFTNCCTYPSTATVLASSPGYINLDPKFVDPAHGDFRLAGDSPCINKGLDADWMRSSTINPVTGKRVKVLDLAGSPRLSGAHVDIGCYELYIPKGVVISVK